MPRCQADGADTGGSGEGADAGAQPARNPVATPSACTPSHPGPTSARHAVAAGVDGFLGEVYSATPVRRHLDPDSLIHHRDPPGRGGAALAHTQRTALAPDQPDRGTAPDGQRSTDGAPIYPPKTNMSVSTTLKT